MAASSIMTLRIDPGLLKALKERAAREGRSVSAEVVRLIKRDVEPARPVRAKRTSTIGMFADFEAPTLEEFRQLRRRFSSRVSSTTTRRRSR
jgi:plasmid stability protein